MSVEITFVRHGQSESNAAGVWQGQGDSALSELGRAQAEALGRRLASWQFDIVLSSDLQRAANTARSLGRDVETDAAWREMNVGGWEGLTMPQVIQRFPQEIADLQKRRDVVIGGGESWGQVYKRVDDAFNALRARMSDGQRAVVVAHGGVIAAFIIGLLNARGRWPWPMGRIRNTALTTLRFNDDTTELVAHNDTAHLGHIAREMPKGHTRVMFHGSGLPLVADHAVEAIDLNELSDEPSVVRSRLSEVAAEHMGQTIRCIADAECWAKLSTEIAASEQKDVVFKPMARDEFGSLLVSSDGMIVDQYGVPNEC